MKLFKKAVVIIHGFTGKLQDNEYLMNYLEMDDSFDVFAKTLPGHTRERFSDATCDDWKNYVDNWMIELIKNGYTTIYIVGHSMGGVLACYLASRYPQVKKLVLINAAFDYGNTKKSGKEEDYNKFGVLWEKIKKTSPKMFFEFTKLVKDGQNYLSGVTCDTLILRSENDEVVPYDTGDFVYRKINTSHKWVTDIKNGVHTVLSSTRKKEVSIYIKYFLKGGREWRKNLRKEI